MYESVLRDTGIHRESPTAPPIWEFTSPKLGGSHRLGPSWDFLEETIFGQGPEPVSIGELFATLAAPPYGLPDGVQPVLLCAFMRVHTNETTLYREGTFIPEPGIADFEVLLRRPELFAIAGSRVEGSRAAIVARLARGLQVEAATVPIVRSLFRRVKSLPDFAWNTRRLSAETLALRGAFQNARSPESFLFAQVPAALGLSPFSEGKADLDEIDRFFADLNHSLQEWAGFYASALNRARDYLLAAFRFPPGELGWERFRGKAHLMEGSVTEPELLAVVRRVLQTQPGKTSVESVCALIASRPPTNWSDDDAERFAATAQALGGRFLAVRRLAGKVNAFANLDTEEQRRAERIADKLRKYLAENTVGESNQVVEAALNSVLTD